MSEVKMDEKIKDTVRERYGDIARHFVDRSAPGAVKGPGQAGCCGQSGAGAKDAAQPAATSSCCGSTKSAPDSAADSRCCEPAARYYSDEELAGLPDTVTGASLGCGNPIAIAELQPGEVVLDLGSGGGIDCFLAARQVGAEGRVIGLDMTTDMIKLARRNARRAGVANVDFRYGEMEEIPLPDASVDVIISNCVINLSPDKDAVFGEAYRVLRPGGRMSVSDIVTDGELPPAIRNRLDAWAGCIAGALDEGVYLGKIRAAGFEGIEVQSREYAGISLEAGGGEMQALLGGPDGEILEGEGVQVFLDEAGISLRDLDHKVASIKVKAYKPG